MGAEFEINKFVLLRFEIKTKLALKPIHYKIEWPCSYTITIGLGKRSNNRVQRNTWLCKMLFPSQISLLMVHGNWSASFWRVWFFKLFFSFLYHPHPKTCLLHFREDIFNQGPLKREQKDRIADQLYCRIV